MATTGKMGGAEGTCRTRCEEEQSRVSGLEWHVWLNGGREGQVLARL